MSAPQDPVVEPDNLPDDVPKPAETESPDETSPAEVEPGDVAEDPGDTGQEPNVDPQ